MRLCEEGHRETNVCEIELYEGGLADESIASAKDCRTTKAVQFAVDIECGRVYDDRGGVLAKVQDGESVMKFGRSLSAWRCSHNRFIKRLDGRERKKHLFAGRSNKYHFYFQSILDTYKV